MSRKQDSHPLSSYTDLGKYLGLGLQLAASFGFGLWVGYVADKRFSTFPIFMLIGVIWGGAAGMWAVYKAAYPRRDASKKGEE